MHLIETQGFGQCLLGQGLFWKGRWQPGWDLLPPAAVEQNELLDLAQLCQQLLHGDSIPGCLGLLVDVLE
jgi:hypothetical protein